MTRFTKKALGIINMLKDAFWQESYGEQIDYIKAIVKTVYGVTHSRSTKILLTVVLVLFAGIVNFCPIIKDIPVIADASSWLNFIQKMVEQWSTNRQLQCQKKRRRNKRSKSARRRPIR
ncbi:hypothetical protein [Thomasclavelia cocleata]|jgi:hypothetical protein|uniref:hypothetical protein n=1 Tax=Thomasclavelia cocleata TaxID=69824 RepID=UPI00256EA0D9|nr:hypothetical protein [Thomasclavelia cocleata]